jgi:LPS sulfotransferase NodH
MRDTIEMAREAGIEFQHITGILGKGTINTTGSQRLELIEQLVALVRADERKQMQAESEADKVIIEYHEATIKRLEEAILAEREACAKVCEARAEEEVGMAYEGIALDCAAAIRARGNT